ncbi:hypothetical protein GCM10010320_58710 [Streptomyces caelestis]|nr:hypothetical protein GCM10010320_58710 [Streptomyces caelestis]
MEGGRQPGRDPVSAEQWGKHAREAPTSVRCFGSEIPSRLGSVQLLVDQGTSEPTPCVTPHRGKRQLRMLGVAYSDEGAVLATSRQALPDVSEYEDLSHINSGKGDTSYSSPAIPRSRSLDPLGFNATCSTKSSRLRKLASWAGASKKTAPSGESTSTVSR